MQNFYRIGKFFWIKLLCFISFVSFAQTDSSVVLNTIQISSQTLNEKKIILNLMQKWLDYPAYNGVYKSDNVHSQENEQGEIQQLFLLQSLFSVSDFKENIYFLKHYSLDNYSNNLQQNQRWMSTYSVKNMGVPKNFPLWGNELVDIFYNLKNTEIILKDVYESNFFSPLHPNNFNEFNYKLNNYEVINQKLLSVLTFTSKSPIPAFSGKIAFNDSDSLLQFVQFSLSNIPIGFGFKSILLNYYFEYKNGEIYLYKLHANYKKLDNSVGNISIKLHLTAQSFPYQNAQLVYNLDSMVNFADSLPKSLNSNDLKFINAADSAKNYWNSPAYYHYLDSVSDKKSLLNILFTGYIKHNHAKQQKYWIAPIIEQMNWIGIGGYRQNLEVIYFKKFKNEKSIQISTQGDYGFNNQDLKGRFRTQFNYNPKKMAFWDLSVGDKYQLLTFGVPLQNFLSRGNYVRNQFVHLKHANELWNGVFLELSGKFSNRTSISNLNLEQWSQNLFGEDNIPLSFNPYRELILEMKWTFTPFQKYELLPKSKRIIGSKHPTLFIDFNWGIPNFFNSSVDFLAFKTGFVKSYQTVNWGRGKYQFVFSKFLSIKEVEFPNYNFFPGSTPFLFLSPMYTFQSLNQTLRTLNPTSEFRFFHEFNAVKKFFQPQIGAGFLIEHNTNFIHHEVFYGLVFPVKIGNNQFKLSLNHVVNTTNLKNYFKIGVNIFNSFSGNWIY